MLSCQLVGIQNHASKYPRALCEDTEPFETLASPRTFGQIQKLAEELPGSPKKKARNCYNCVHQNDLVLHCLPPPELLGATNKTFDGLNEAWGKDQAIDSSKANGFIRWRLRGAKQAPP